MNKKVFIITIILLILAIIGVAVYLVMQRNNEKQTKEIQPQEEISDDQMRQTIVTLYYQNKETKELMPEGRMVDVKTLLADPYATLINLLMDTPKSDNLQTVIPEGTKVLNIELKNDVIYLNLSNEFINNHKGGLEEEKATVYSLVNTLTELNEVNSVKILINGEENKAFKDEKLNFKEEFTRTSKK